MTIEEAKKDIPTFIVFADEMCNYCQSDAYCPSYAPCETLQKAKKMFDRVQHAYAKYDGDILKVDRYIKGAKMD